ncbi:MAG: cytochrome D1 domain-containing protein [Alphaproteobacteria bacterium]
MQNRELIIATVKENVSLSAIDAESGEIVAAVTVGTKDIAKPHEIAVTKDGRHAYVSLYGDKDYGPNTPDNRLGIVDLSDFSFAGHLDLGLYKGPHALMTDHDGLVWVTVDPNRCVLVIDPDKREIVHTIHLGVPGHFLAPSPDGRTVYFSAKEYPDIVEVDVVTKQITARMQVPVGAQAIRVSPDGRFLYAGDFHRPLLHILDSASRNLVRTVSLTGVPGWPFNSNDGRLIIVTTYDEPADRGFVELLEAYDPENRIVIDVPSEPFHALPLRDDRHALVALANGNIAKIDLLDGKLVDGGFSAGGTMPETLMYLN